MNGHLFGSLYINISAQDRKDLNTLHLVEHLSKANLEGVEATSLESISPEKLDELDFRIIRLLEEDSRLSLHKIASKLGISVGTAHNRTKSLEDQGIIKAYTVLLDHLKLGYAMTALILIQTEGAHIVDAENEIAKNENVISVYDITGEFDIAVIVRFKDREGLNSFVKKLLTLSYIKRTVTNVALNVVKEDFRLRFV